MLAVGCTELKGSNSTSQASAPHQTQNGYQDAEWNESLHKYTRVLGPDFKNAQAIINNANVSDNLDNSNYTTLTTLGQNIVDNSQAAITENEQYTVSPQLQDAQKEWGLALEDCNSAGKYIILLANDIKSGNTSSKFENLEKFIKYRNSMNVHLKKTATLMKGPSGTDEQTAS